MNQKISFVFIATLLFLQLHTTAQTYKHQIGIRLGSSEQVISSGISYRYLFSTNKAVEGIVNLRNEAIAVGALYEIFQPISSVKNLQWYYGGGAYIGFMGFDNFGVMGIAGLDYQFTEVPVNLSIDWKPELNLIEGVNFRASTVAVSIRFALAKK